MAASVTVVLYMLLHALLISCESQSVPTGSFLRYADLGGKSYTVTSDERSWIIDGKRTILLGGSVHYPRLSPGQWKDILTKMLNDGLNHAEVYVFWNIHEPSYDFSGTHKYNYEGRANLTGFLEMAAKVGLFVNLRIGPYVCAEWSFGGLPTWLLHIPGISFRDDNNEWEQNMQTFIEEIRDIIKPYLAKNGGPVILAQIENEYHGSGASGAAYVEWCGQLTQELGMNVSWVMCNGESANDTINTCNGNNCYNYAKSHSTHYPGQPLGWTENEGWFQSWGGGYNPNTTSGNNRSPESMAYVVALWFAAGAAHHNYYMWYGGNHVSWTAGSGITSMYADGVNLHADGLFNEPKKSHLMRLHNIISEYGEYPLMESPIQIGHEIPINGSAITLALMMESCNTNSKYQQWSYNSSTGQLRASAFGQQHCVVSNGKENPVLTMQCNTKNKHQKWTYSEEQFKSTDNTCLDIFGGKGPNVDEYSCKSSNAKNQEWTINGNQIKSVLNGQCLSAESIPTAVAYQYHSTSKGTNMTFLVNMQSYDQNVNWKGKNYNLSGQSVTILDTNNNILFDTSIVNTTGLATKRTYTTIYSGSSDLKFASWTEDLPLYKNTQNRPDSPTMNPTPMEQIRFTNDTFEYLFYSTNVTFKNAAGNVSMIINGRTANSYLVYVDANYKGEAWDGSHGRSNKVFTISVSDIPSTTFTLTVVSSSLGISNGISNQQGSSAQDMKGIVGNITINNQDITDSKWNHWIGRTGELLNVAGSGMNKVTWKSPIDNNNGLTWYKTTFNTPDQVNNNNGVILVDIGTNGNGMKRGHWFLNGMDMGHYNNVEYNNMMVQQYYFIPNDYLTSNKGVNTLVFAEELSQVTPANTNIVYSTFVVP